MKLAPAANIASKEFFQVFLLTYLLMTVAETMRQGTVSNFFNMNYLLLVVLASGVTMVLTEQSEEPMSVRYAPKRIIETSGEKIKPAADWVRSSPPARTIARTVHIPSIDGIIQRQSTYASRKARPRKPPAQSYRTFRQPKANRKPNTDGFI